MLDAKNNGSLGLALSWLSDSGIQSASGAFYAWRNLETGSYSFLYSEITGYAVTALLFLHKISGDKTLIGKARQAASWLINEAMHPCGGVKARLYASDAGAEAAYSFSGGNIFSFDTGMVLYGLVNLYKVTGETRFLEASRRLADFLLDKMLAPAGSLSAVYNPDSGRNMESFDKWSNQAGAFGAKVCLGLADIFQVTKDERYRDAAMKMCVYALSLQEKDGRFITNRQDRTTHLHPHLYAAEGLFYSGVAFAVEEFIRAASRAVEWVFNSCPPRQINEIYSPSTRKFSDFQRSDILAQALRLGLIFGIRPQALSDLKEHLTQYQSVTGDSSAKGGFIYTKDSRHVNSWCTMFGLQALALYQDRKLIPPDKKVELFI